MSSCSQTEDLNFSTPIEFEGTTRSLDINGENFQRSTLTERVRIAQWFAQNYTLEEAQRIHNAITEAVNQGLDEVYFLREYTSLSASLNKISQEAPSTTSKRMSKVREEIQKNYQQQKINSSSELSFYEIFDEYLQIYWPYSDNWDGQTAPVIVYAPENINDLKAYGYRVGNDFGILKTVLVNEEYCQTHPVWIINESETAYSDLPNFNNGERISRKGIYFSTPNVNTNYRDTTYQETEGIMTLKLGKVKSTKNHDSWVAGGSEYSFRFGYLANTNLTCEADTSNCDKLLSKIRVTFKRGEIKSGVEKEMNSVAVSEWPLNLYDVVLKVVEEDPGKENQTYDTKVSITWRSKDYGFDISIPFGNHDDEIGEKRYTRDFIRSTNNKSAPGVWEWDNSDGLYWTLPYKIGYINEEAWEKIHP